MSFKKKTILTGFLTTLLIISSSAYAFDNLDELTLTANKMRNNLTSSLDYITLKKKKEDVNVDVKLFYAIMHFECESDLKEYYCDQLPDNLRYEFYRTHMVRIFYTPWDTTYLEKLLPSPHKKALPFELSVLALTQMAFATLSYFAHENAVIPPAYLPFIEYSEGDYDTIKTSLVEFLTGDKVYYQAIKSMVNYPGYQNFLETFFTKETKPFFLSFDIHEINRILDEGSQILSSSQPLSFEDMASLPENLKEEPSNLLEYDEGEAIDVLQKTSSSIPASLPPADLLTKGDIANISMYASSLRPTTKISRAFEFIFEVCNQNKDKSMALSIDFDDTFLLSKERLSRHYKNATINLCPSPVDLAVIDAANNLMSSFEKGINISFYKRLKGWHQDQLMSRRLPTLLQEAMDRGIAVFINTARPGTPQSRTYTLEQLTPHINLAHEGESQKHLIKIPKGPIALDGTKFNIRKHPTRIPYFDKENILYTDGWHKGDILDLYLQAGGIQFDILFHLDDQWDQVASMYNVFSQKTTTHVFYFIPQKIQPFSSVEALNQYINKNLRKNLSDYPKEDLDWTKGSYLIV